MEEKQLDVRQLAGRIAKLERQNRLLKWGGLLAIVVLALLLGAGLRAQEAQSPYRGNTISAERFLLKSGNGKILGEWSATPGGGAIALYSPDGKVIWSSEPRIQE
ncbi:MAG TPA: hypothetical protein VGR36_07365 [Candidatus Acidoferrales bacterium]|nr:hypothetical protein [Candidatus Acidoferrales bacterium]